MTLGVTKTIDPSEGTNYTGGSSYSPGMPLLPSNAGLAGFEGSVLESHFGSMSAEEALRWSPSPLTQRLNALRVMNAQPMSGLQQAVTFNPVFYWLGAAALAFWFWTRTQEVRPTFFGR